MLCETCMFQRFRDERDGGLARYCARDGWTSDGEKAGHCADPNSPTPFEVRDNSSGAKLPDVHARHDGPVPDPGAWQPYDTHNACCGFVWFTLGEEVRVPV